MAEKYAAPAAAVLCSAAAALLCAAAAAASVSQQAPEAGVQDHFGVLGLEFQVGI